MRTEYGVPVPRGVRKDWDCSSMDVMSGGHVLRKYHVDPMWENPQRCVAWFDRFDRMRVIVGHYPNGRSATVRVDANGRWSTTFSRFASVDARPKDGDALSAPLASSAVGNAETPNNLQQGVGDDE